MKMQSKLIVLGTLVGTLAASAAAAPVTYWFSGYVAEISNPSNTMPFSVSIGAPFAAQLTYDPSLVGFANVNSYPQGDVGFYYFTNTALRLLQASAR
jgi:hypothetical protein